MEVMEDATFILGPDVARFEENFASYIGARHCVGVESGTAALQFALEALGIGAGDEVIVPANTYIASALAVSAVGAKPVLVDVDQNYLIDPHLLDDALTPRTKAIMPVHLYGQAVPMDAILEFARRHGLYVIEDASQAHGARWNGKCAGSFGDLGAFSFYPGKNLGAYGDGGAIVTNDAGLADRLLLLRDFGQRKKYEHLIKGGNCRLDSIQAAVLDVKLRYLDSWNEARRRHAAAYDARLAEDRHQAASAPYRRRARLPSLRYRGRASRASCDNAARARRRHRHPLSDSDSSAAGVRRSRSQPRLVPADRAQRRSHSVVADVPRAYRRADRARCRRARELAGARRSIATLLR